MKKFVYILLGLILILAFVVRVYRVDQILAFYFDQGRDALVIWDFWHKGKFFLIGPVTGIAGIFRGPWYYWLIAPFYLIGKGDPIYPSIFLSLTSVFAIFILYKLGEEIGGKGVGFLAAIIASFSYYLVLASRWLSNPTPMLLIGVSLIWAVFKIEEKKFWTWPLISFLVGMAIQFGSAAEIFYIPVILVIAFWKRKFLPTKKIIFLSLAIFFATFSPQIVFDIKHNGILIGAIKKFLFEDKSFKISFWEMLKIRLPFYQSVFSSKLFPLGQASSTIFSWLAFGSFLFNIKYFWKNTKFRIILLFFISPLIGMLFFQGNYGNVYDYYFTGYYLIFILLFSYLIVKFFNGIWGKILVVAFLFFFFQQNLVLDRNYITAGVDGPTTIAFGNQKQAIDWVYQDAGSRNFNVDVYVPPVIPYAYDYLFKWYGGVVHGREPSEKNINLLYTLYEVDPPHPERLEAWLKRQKGIGVVEIQAQFGGIVVQRRQRI